MDKEREPSKLWISTLLENTQILQRVQRSPSASAVEKEVEFRSIFSSKESALDARNALKAAFSNCKELHVLIMNVDADRVYYYCILSAVLLAEPSAITEIELGVLDICLKFGGGAVSWEFLSSGPANFH